MTLPPNTYGVRCEFHPGSSTRYTYLVDLLHHGEINLGDHVVVASPKGGYKVIYVVGRAEDLAPVDLKYMKYVVQKVNTDYYDVLMHNLIAGDERASPPTSPLVDEGDPGSQYTQHDDLDVDPPDGDAERGRNVPSNSME